MKDNMVYLSYYDIMILLFEFEEARQDKDNENENYLSMLVNQFFNYFMEQLIFNGTRGMLFKIPSIVLNNLKIYSMSVSMYELLINFTGVNLEDKQLRKYYKKFIDSYVEYLANNRSLESYKKLIKKNEGYVAEKTAD